jgi:hypothetical protein
MEERIAFDGLPGSQDNMVAQSDYAFSVAFLPIADVITITEYEARSFAASYFRYS